MSGENNPVNLPTDDEMIQAFLNCSKTPCEQCVCYNKRTKYEILLCTYEAFKSMGSVTAVAALLDKLLSECVSITKEYTKQSYENASLVERVKYLTAQLNTAIRGKMLNDVRRSCDTCKHGQTGGCDLRVSAKCSLQGYEYWVWRYKIECNEGESNE